MARLVIGIVIGVALVVGVLLYFNFNPPRGLFGGNL
jgi:hypothetical protein